MRIGSGWRGNGEAENRSAQGNRRDVRQCPGLDGPNKIGQTLRRLYSNVYRIVLHLRYHHHSYDSKINQMPVYHEANVPGRYHMSVNCMSSNHCPRLGVPDIRYIRHKPQQVDRSCMPFSRYMSPHRGSPRPLLPALSPWNASLCRPPILPTILKEHRSVYDMSQPAWK